MTFLFNDLKNFCKDLAGKCMFFFYFQVGQSQAISIFLIMLFPPLKWKQMERKQHVSVLLLQPVLSRMAGGVCIHGGFIKVVLTLH